LVKKMGEKKDKAKSILGFIALGCAIVVACVVAAPAMAVVGVVVGTTTIISASTVVGATAIVATVGATAAVSKAVLHVTDGEYQEAVESAVMAVPMIGAAYTYGNAYIGMTSTSGRMTTGSSSSQAGAKSNPSPNQTTGNNGGQGGSGGTTGNTGNGSTNTPDYVVTSKGDVIPVPKGATGPSDVVNQAGKVTGSAYTGGSGGANGQVSTVRIMDPTPPRGSSPGYPHGYVKYENASGQGVDPITGRTIPNSQSHFPLQGGD
jgi:hypothetical protein